MGSTTTEGSRDAVLKHTYPPYSCFLSFVGAVAAAGTATGTADTAWWRVPSLLIPWTILHGARLCNGDAKLARDSALFSTAVILGCGKEILRSGYHGLWEKERWIVVALCGMVFSLGEGLVRGVGGMADDDVDADGDGHVDAGIGLGVPEGACRWVMRYPPAYILPSKTTHARVFPKKHSFGYSYLLCGFPVVPAFVTAEGEDVGDGQDARLGSWWLRIRAEDYLFRGQGELGFYGKLKAFLRKEGVGDAEWSYAYLVTAPRFFGYSFNPVSFWYVYDGDQQLKKMVLEVNNTFGERRMYLLDGSSPPAPPQTPGSDLSADSKSSKSRFTDAWTKDFHVSPFNSRKGSYALKALDPFPDSSFTDPKIDNTITLKSSKDHAKIVARIFTTGKAIESAKMDVLQTLRFIGSWWWVGFVTFPRIVREAGKLYFKRSLHVWFRPEVLSPSIGRMPTQIEDDLQRFFQDYLTHLVKKCPEVIEIEYKTAIPERPQQMIKSNKPHSSTTEPKRIELCISTPAFYSRFVHYAHTSEALDRECLFTDEKNRTLWASHPDILFKLFSLPSSSNSKLRIDSTETKLPPPQTHFTSLENLRWTLLRKLRCTAPEPAYPVTQQSPAVIVNDIRTLPYSELDVFVRTHGRGDRYKAAYRRMVTKVFLAQRFALGFVEIVDVVDFVVRGVLCGVGVRVLWGALIRADGEAIGVGNVQMDRGWGRMVLGVLGVSGCHLYGLSKG